MKSVKSVIPLHHSLGSRPDILSLHRRIDQLENQLSFYKGQTTLIIPTEEGMVFIEQKEILHCTAASSSCLIYTSDQKFCISKTLKWVADRLAEEEFIRVHSSHMINISAILSYRKRAKPSIQLKNGKSIPVSRSYRASFEKIFDV